MSDESGTDPGETVLAQFVDLHGIPRGNYVPASRWETVCEQGAGFAALVMEVFETRTGRGIVPEPSYGPAAEELRAVPVPETRTPMPWTDRETTMAQCTIEHEGGTFDLCSRSTLASVVADYEDRGLSPTVGAELEFTLLADPSISPGGGENPASEDRDLTGASPDRLATTGARPYDVRTLEATDGYVSDLLDALATMGVGVERVHREGSPGQFEVSLAPDDPLAAADAVVAARQAIRGVGRNHGYGVTFMPFPSLEYEGNGLHLHVSLDSDDANAFADPDDEHGLSSLGYRFVGGLLDHADGLTAVSAPTVNSYKRFQPGTFAPVDRTYGYDNRTAMVRIPPSDPDEARVENRLPDSYANPYLALAGTLATGLSGIDDGTEPPAPDDPDRYGATDDEPTLPGDLGTALSALEADDCLRDALGEGLVAQFCRVKRDELRRLHGTVTDWEVEEYVDKL